MLHLFEIFQVVVDVVGVTFVLVFTSFSNCISNNSSSSCSFSCSVLLFFASGSSHWDDVAAVDVVTTARFFPNNLIVLVVPIEVVVAESAIPTQMVALQLHEFNSTRE